MPDEFSIVTIPDVSTTTFASTVIATGTVEINALCMDTRANLIVQEEANLVVYEVIIEANRKSLMVHGLLTIVEVEEKRNQKGTVTLS